MEPAYFGHFLKDKRELITTKYFSQRIKNVSINRAQKLLKIFLAERQQKCSLSALQ